MQLFPRRLRKEKILWNNLKKADGGTCRRGKKEAEMLMAYMPEQMSEEDVRNEVKRPLPKWG